LLLLQPELVVVRVLQLKLLQQPGLAVVLLLAFHRGLQVAYLRGEAGLLPCTLRHRV
jgi:hypothetical protein